MSPRPILKQSSYSNPPPHQRYAVHFPPSPSLTRTFYSHSSSTYDRSPIVVDQNSCALPERGCPGRTYNIDDQRRTYPSDYHPRALAFASSSQRLSNLPQLIPDLSSESEESDSSILNNNEYSYGVHGLPIPSPRLKSEYPIPYSQDIMIYTTPPQSPSAVNGATSSPNNNPLSFLPYSPSYPNDETFHGRGQSKPITTQKRRRGERERKHESSRDPDRIRSGDSEVSTTATSVRKSSSSSSSRKRGGESTRPSSATLCMSFSSFGLNDDGCLGGF